MIQWEEPLCGCFRNFGICLAVLCPGGLCLVQALAVKRATGDGCCVPFCCPILLCCIGAGINRHTIRDRYLISGSRCKDCMVHVVLAPCAVCQEYREVKGREEKAVK